jgi:hypothetical protein
LWERFLPKTLARLTGGLFLVSSFGAHVVVNPIGQPIDSGHELSQQR